MNEPHTLTAREMLIGISKQSKETKVAISFLDDVLKKAFEELREMYQCPECEDRGYIRDAGGIDFCVCRRGNELRFAVLDFIEHPIVQYNCEFKISKVTGKEKQGSQQREAKGARKRKGNIGDKSA